MAGATAWGTGTLAGKTAQRVPCAVCGKPQRRFVGTEAICGACHRAFSTQYSAYLRSLGLSGPEWSRARNQLQYREMAAFLRDGAHPASLDRVLGRLGVAS